MKKFMTLALCVAAVGSMSAQKEKVDAAKKLSGKFDKIEEARSLIKDATSDPSTGKDANTYYVAGKIEFDAFDNGVKQGQIKPDDPSANRVTLAEELLNGYNYFLKALPLDSVPNEKGEIKPKVSGDIVKKLAGHTVDYFRAGSSMWEAGRYYPDAYQCFLIYADMPDQAFLGKNAPKLSAAERAQGYDYAGRAAYYGKNYLDGAHASRKARLIGADDPTTYVFELANWQEVARDSTMEKEAYKNIKELSDAGYQKFGINPPVFISNLVNYYVLEDNYDKAIETVNSAIANNPNSSNLYGLLGFIYDRQKNDEQSLANYAKAVAMEDCDYETLKNAAKKLIRVGSNKYADLDMKDSAGKASVRTNYYDPAYEIALRAKAVRDNNPETAGKPDSDLNRIIDNIQYALEQYYGVKF